MHPEAAGGLQAVTQVQDTPLVRTSCWRVFNSWLCLSVRAELEQLPAHLRERPHLFSMDDLLRLKKGELAARARAALHAAIGHVEACQVSELHDPGRDPRPMCKTWASFLTAVSGSRLHLRVLQRQRRHLCFSDGRLSPLRR